jgi:transposase
LAAGVISYRLYTGDNFSSYERRLREAVYEAGYFGYWLHDRLVEYGAACAVTPPSLIPQGANRVKTDRLDSRKWARLLAKGMLKGVWVPSPQEREHRQVIRRRRQMIQDWVRILCSVPGVGLIAAMELLLELQDVARFRRADELAAYVGLTPSQHTSADKVRMGRITKVGKGSLRAMLVEASWLLIRKDAAMKQTYGFAPMTALHKNRLK